MKTKLNKNILDNTRIMGEIKNYLVLDVASRIQDGIESECHNGYDDNLIEDYLKEELSYFVSDGTDSLLDEEREIIANYLLSNLFLLVEKISNELK